MSTPKILAFAGSARAKSYNKSLAVAACRLAAESGAEATFIDLADFPMPIFNEDIEDESGMPGPAAQLKAMIMESDALLLACPEYNSSITPLLKNTIDWVSRSTSENEGPVAAFRGKVIGLLSASPGGLGGMRGLVHVRSIFGNIGSIVIPDQYSLRSAHSAFDEAGNLSDERAKSSVSNVVKQLIEVTRKLKSE